jgi:hypothetical protein
MQQLYPCFGLSFLGLCAYNPSQPAPTYFTVGDGIAALGFMLAIQQLFKPIYRFRLRAYGLRIVYLAWAVSPLGLSERILPAPPCPRQALA